MISLLVQEQYVKVTEKRGQMLSWCLPFRKDVEGRSGEMKDFIFSSEVVEVCKYLWRKDTE